MSTPYGRVEHRAPIEPGVPLEAGEATRYRALVARLNCLALDRLDIQYAVNEAARRMAVTQSRFGIAPGYRQAT